MGVASQLLTSCAPTLRTPLIEMLRMGLNVKCVDWVYLHVVTKCILYTDMHGAEAASGGQSVNAHVRGTSRKKTSGSDDEQLVIYLCACMQGRGRTMHAFC